MEREKRIILAKLSQEIRSKIQLFQQSFKLFTLLDFFRSVTAALGDLETIIPEFSKEGFELIEATNPVLFIQNQKRNRPTIPLSLKTNREKSLILVSGPNAGGKSVALKTVGLILHHLLLFLQPARVFMAVKIRHNTKNRATF